MQATSQTTVAAPIDVVWNTLSDHVGMMGWGPGVTVTMDRPGTAEANGLGAVRRIATPGPGPDIVEEIVTYDRPHVMAYKALSGTPFPGYTGEVRLTEAGAGTHIHYTISSTAKFPLVKAPLAVIGQVLMRLLARAALKAHRGSK
jgi:carbon monoxide dehydrogenase subunit G